MSASEGSTGALETGAFFAAAFLAAGGADFFLAAVLRGAALADLGAEARFFGGCGAGAEVGGMAGAASAGGAASVDSDFVFFGTGVMEIGFESISGEARDCKRFSQSGCVARAFSPTVATVRHFVFRWMVTTVAVMVASALVSGIRYDSIGALIGAALLLGILNAFVRPLLLLLSAPLILLSLGLFILVINGFLLLWVPTFVPGFHVDRFGSAFWGAIVVGLVSWILSAFFRGSDGRVHVLTHHAQIKRVEGRVVDPGEGRLR